MTRFFFNIESGSHSTDQIGFCFASAAEARAEAIKTCGEMLRDAPASFWESKPWNVTVTDDMGLILWAVSVDGFSSPAGEKFA